MKKNAFVTVMICMTIFSMAGCAVKPPQTPPQPVLVTGETDKQKIVQASIDVLQKMHFTIDKADPSAGIVQTRPLSGQDFIEFWRDDATTFKDLAYSSIHSIQKTVEIEILSDKISCQVPVRRLSMPPRELTGFDDLPRIMSKSSASMQHLGISSDLESDMSWIYIGNDEGLAVLILEKIQKKLQENRI